MDITEWRNKIDDVDRQLVRLLNERAAMAQQIGRLKRETSLPIYEPDREAVIFRNIDRENRGPLRTSDLHHIFERIIDVMRSLQKNEAQASAAEGTISQKEQS